MFTEDSTAISKMDTIVYLYAILTVASITFAERFWTIPVFFILNIVVLVFFSLWIWDVAGLSGKEIFDYLADNIIGLIGLGVGSILMLRINQNALNRAEMEIKKNERFNAELEQKVKQRTLELEGALFSAREMTKQAQSATKAKSNFLASMSHEIRTPMNAIIAISSLMKAKALTEEQAEMFEIIRSSSDSLLNIINDILDFSKVEAGRMELESIEFNLREVFDDLLDIMVQKAEQKQIKFGCFVDPGIDGFVVGDPGRFRQVLINLINNAIKFTAKGFVRTDVKCVQERERELIIRCEVTDSGIGISEDNSIKLFQPFSQVDTSHTRKFGGTGLGLSISKHLVQLMGGNLGVESEEGKGSTFWFQIPLIRQDPKSIMRKSEPIDLSGKQILCITPDPFCREYLETHLTFWGSTLTMADSLNDYRDILMREESGFDACFLDLAGMAHPLKEIRSGMVQDKVPIKIIGFLPWNQIAEASNYSEFGFQGYLTKPLKYLNLIRAVTALSDPQTAMSERSGEVDSHKESGEENKPFHMEKQILVAEDNVVNRKVIWKLLNHLGYSPDFVKNGQEAVDAVSEKQYDLLLLDVQMPVKSGLEAAQEIAQLDLAKRPVIIALTANALQGDRERCLAAGMDDFLSKPVSLNQLKEKLNTWLD